jgi:DNA-binding NarL/FixJ family response regulator
LAEAVDRNADLLVLKAVGAHTESALPFAHLHQLLQPVLGRLDGLPAVQGRAVRTALGLESGDDPDRFAIALGVLTLLADAASEQPLLCIVDDAQWVDAETLDAITFVGRRIEREPIGILLASNRPLAVERIAFPAPEITVNGLDRVASDALLIERAGSTPAPQVRAALWSNTGGNPLALIETLDALTAEQLQGSAALPDRPEVGSALHQALLSRVDRLPASATALLLVAAAEDTGDLGCVMRACRTLSIDDDALATAELGGIVSITDGRIAFRHPMMRSTIYQNAPFGKRREAHLAIADCLAADDDRRAWHRASAVVGQDDVVADELETVATRAHQRGGHAAASVAWQRASDLTSDTAQAGRRMVAAAAEAWAAGQPQRCAGLLQRADPLANEPAVRTDLEHMRWLVESAVGDRRIAFQGMLAAATAISELDLSKSTQLVIDAGHLAWADADLAGMTEIARRLTDVTVPNSDPLAFNINVMLGLGSVLSGDTAHGLPIVRAAITSADPNDPVQLHIAGTAAMFVGDDHTSSRLLTDAIARLRRDSLLSRLPHTLSNLASLETWSGNPSTARMLATEGVELSREAGQAQHTAACLGILAWLAAMQGRQDDCETAGAEAVEIAARHRVRRPVALATWATAMLAVGQGRWVDAISPLETLANDQSPEYHPTVGLLSAGDLIETAHRIGRADVSMAALERLDRFVERSGTAWAAAVAARCRALLTDDDGADHHFTKALERHAAGSRRFDEARTRLLYGEHLRRDRRKSEARIQLRHAIDAFERLDAHPWADRARAELRATGETARKREPATMSQLTAQQLQIVRLVTEGASNKDVAGQLFLSTRTVDYHLRNVFTKLGITSRAELIRLSTLDEIDR